VLILIQNLGNLRIGLVKKARILLFFIFGLIPLAGSTQIDNMDPTKPWVIIFLDIDGVLYREPIRDNFWQERHEKMVELFGQLDHYRSFHYDSATAYYFDKKAVTLLNNFIDKINLSYNVGLVISSAWREGRTLEEMYKIFSPWHFSKFIIDKTVSSAYGGYTIEELRNFSYGYASRADQINHWLKHHSDINIGHFIIFDDQDSGISKRFPTQFIHVKNRCLSSENIEAAIKVLYTQNDSRVGNWLRHHLDL
jgi:hypothetical protein